MKIEPEKKASLLAPLADAYGPTQVQTDRLFAKLKASLGEELDAAPFSARGSQASVGREGGAWKAKGILLVGISCVALAISSTLMLRASPPAPAVRQTSMTVSPSTATGASEAPREKEGAPAVAAVSVDALPAVASVATIATVPPAKMGVTKVTAGASTSSRTPSSSDTLEREARLLTDARRAFKDGDGAGALALLDEHARVFPRGWLANERLVERIVVLCSLGRRVEAVREAAAFLEGRPKGALTRRVEMSCAGQPAKGNEE